jgi:Tfp pilus assembly protein PilN
LKEQITSFLNGNSAYGVDLIFLPNGELSYYFIELNSKKKEVEIAQKKQGDSLESFFNLDLNSQIPIYLTVRGKGVLSKKVITEPTTARNEIIRKALPNAKEDDFYFSTSQQAKDTSWVQLVRKEQVNKLFNQFKESGFSIVSVFLGYAEVERVASLLPQSQVVISSDELHFDNGQLTAVNASDKQVENVKLGDDFISANYLPSFACAFNHFIKQKNTKVASDYLLSEENEFTQKRLFSVGLKSVLAFFLVLLLSNFFFFQHYSKKDNELSEKLQINKSQLDLLSELKEEKKSKEQFFLKTDLISSSHNAFYADRLAATRPAEITWNELNINPSNSKIEKGEDIEFSIKTINLNGTTPDSRTLNSWLSILDQEPWVKSINIKGFQKEERKSFSKFNLQIEIK